MQPTTVTANHLQTYSSFTPATSPFILQYLSWQYKLSLGSVMLGVIEWRKTIWQLKE